MFEKPRGWTDSESNKNWSTHFIGLEKPEVELILKLIKTDLHTRCVWETRGWADSKTNKTDLHTRCVWETRGRADSETTKNWFTHC